MDLNCETVKTRLSAFLDRELAPEESAGVERHLRGCEACAREAEELAGVLETLDGWKVAGEPPDFRPALRRRIERFEQARPRPLVSRSRQPNLSGLLRYAAAVLLGFVAGLYALGLMGASPSDGKASSPEERIMTDLQIGQFDDLPAGTLGEAFTVLAVRSEETRIGDP